jgi:hypothetical protein
MTFSFSAFGKFFSSTLLIATTIALLAVSGLSSCRSIKRNTQSKPIEHSIWDGLMKKHITTEGWVRYEAFQADTALLNQYLRLLSSAHPNDLNWSVNEQKAYWINAYNAFTIKIVLDHYPIESIKDIKNGIPFVNTVWDIKFIKIEGFTYDLNNIEHNILRPVFKDPRIHAAVNCASFSCPRLRAAAYTAKNLDQELDESMLSFLTDPNRNQINGKQAKLSKIFDWFAGDFRKKSGSVQAFIQSYLPEYQADTDVSYLDYDWKLNASK